MKYKILLKRARENEQLIFESLDGISVNTINQREFIVASFLTLSMQHYSSILLLIENNLESSAIALSRPLYDSSFRGAWMTLVATDTEIDNFAVNKFKFKQTYKLVKDIDKVFGEDMFYTLYQENSNFLHGFTHGGLEQISRQINKERNKFKVTFEDNDICTLIKNSIANISLIILAYSSFQKNDELRRLSKKLMNDD